MSGRDLIKEEIERRKRERAERKRLWKQNMIRSGQAVTEEKKQNAADGGR
ncbi:hypothetical protein [Dictyobacter arantiisoli]|uniref:Uncharacterized protein n=1 Tax=Dictyobacter arantiisoli TaxID=2014874 RepID=A0A5A5TJJ3_9CHLR|nr:hypothetical protein [Dictyobacter arantiisoli]GCF11780.1 hypothetical protein KDI_53440 [Dictyobacter arantiisoli]